MYWIKSEYNIKWTLCKSIQWCIELEADTILNELYINQFKEALNKSVNQNYWKIYTMNQSGMKFILMVVKWIQTLKQQKQLNEIIKMRINEKIKKSDFNK